MKVYKHLGLLALTTTFVHCGAHAGTVSTAARVSSDGVMSIGRNGSSLSVATSSQSARASTWGAVPAHGGARVVGETATRGSGMAFNTSTGAATGWAQASGAAAATAQGHVSGACPPADAAGRAGSRDGFTIRALPGQGSAVTTDVSSGFKAVVGRHSGIAHTRGFVNGNNTSTALADMKPAEVQLESSGYFHGSGRGGDVPFPHP